MSDINEPFSVADVFASGVAPVECLGDGIFRVRFFVLQNVGYGSNYVEKAVVQKVIVSRAGLHALSLAVGAAMEAGASTGSLRWKPWVREKLMDRRLDWAAEALAVWAKLTEAQKRDVLKDIKAIIAKGAASETGRRA